MKLPKPGRYFVQFVRSDRNATREFHYYVNANSPDDAMQACLRGLTDVERLKICDGKAANCSKAIQTTSKRFRG